MIAECLGKDVRGEGCHKAEQIGDGDAADGQADDADLVAERTGLEVIGAVPWDEAFADAERNRRAPIDDAPVSGAVREIESVVDRLVTRGLVTKVGAAS